MEKEDIPKCAFSDCNNLGFVQYYGKFVCGNCLVKHMEKEKEKFWNGND